MFIGGYVSASGVGMTCPHWPLCPAGIVPMSDFIIEYIHRTVGMEMTSIIASGAAVGQVSLGGVVIVEQLHATLVTTHLGLGLVMFSMTLMTAMYAYRLPSKGTEKRNTSLFRTIK
jgi:cytochrome c oxidase assembly protein subunit 15